MDDQTIIALFWERNQTAITAVETQYGAKLYQLAFNILNSPADAEECVSDTYFKIWNAVPPERPVHLFAYLAKICRNQALGKVDYQTAAKRSGLTVSLHDELEQCIPAHSSVEAQADAAQLGRLLNTFLKGLPREQRLLFLRRYWYGDSIAAIAKRYNLSESKTKTTLFRTRKKLKKFLDKEDFTI